MEENISRFSNIEFWFILFKNIQIKYDTLPPLTLQNSMDGIWQKENLTEKKQVWHKNIGLNAEIRGLLTTNFAVITSTSNRGYSIFKPVKKSTKVRKYCIVSV